MTKKKNPIIAVVIRQYGTGLYRTCVSLNKNNVTYISTHPDEQSAVSTIDKFWEAYDEGKVNSQEDVTTFAEKITEPKNPTTPVAIITPAPMLQNFIT